MGSKSSMRSEAGILVALMLLGTSCAMRVSGVVRDGTSGDPIGGAVVTADDGRNRVVTTDPAGRYAVKTSWKATTLTVSAPGYQANTVPVADSERFPIVFVDLQRAFPAATVRSSIEPAGSGTAHANEDGRPATKLRELRDLHDRGLISDDEYKRTRSRIVGEL